MKQQDIFLAVLLAFLILFAGPTKVTPDTSVYAQLAAEGMVATHVADHEYSPTPIPDDKVPSPPEPVKAICRCQSNCGQEGCQCQTSGKGCMPEVKAEVVDETKEVVLVQQVIFLTAKWCGPCQTWKNVDKKVLVDAGWTVGTGPRNIIREVDIDERPDLWAKYSQGNGVPQFVLLNHGKVVSFHIGYQNYLVVSRMLKSP